MLVIFYGTELVKQLRLISKGT